MRISQRQVIIGMQAMMIAGLFLLTIYQLIATSPAISIFLNALGTLGAAALLFSYVRGWHYARPAIILVSVLLSGFVPPPPLFTLNTALSLLIPPVTALILGAPKWVVISAVGAFAIFVLRSDPQTIAGEPSFYILLVLIVGGMALARIVTDTALENAQQNEQRAEEAQAHAEQQSQQLAAANQRLEQQLAQQGQLIELVATLETPVSPLAAGLLFAPVVGHLDTRRIQELTGRLLAEVSAQRGRVLILDIAGVRTIDTAVARGLLDAAQALRLLGCDVILSGISADVAITLTQLDIGIEGVATVRNPQEALARYLKHESQLLEGHPQRA